LSKSGNLQFRLTANYNYAINPGFGFNGVLNYRFKQFKNL
jgi:xanthine/uracil/vitamin C permease (AzgA family)